MPVVMIPELAVVVCAVVGAPAAVAGMLLWKLDPGDVTLMGVSVDNWVEALTLGPLQVVVSLALLGWVAPAVARGHAHAVRRLLAPSPPSWTPPGCSSASRSSPRAAQVQSMAWCGTAPDRARPPRRHTGRSWCPCDGIGIAKQTMADDPEKAAKLLDDARDGAEQAMNELRGVLRTMYPPILADRGLAGAVSALAARCPLPVELRIGELGQRPGTSRGRCVLRGRGVAHQRDRNTVRPGMSTYCWNGVVQSSICRSPTTGSGDAVNEQTDLLGRGSGLHGMLHRVQAIDGQMELREPDRRADHR